MGGRGASSGSGGSFNSDERDAIEYYVSGDGMWINQFFRGNEALNGLSDGEKAFVRDLDSVTNRNVGEQTVYRSVDASAIFGNISDTDYERLVGHLVYGDNQRIVANSARKTLSGVQNRTITEKGYMSTTSDYRVARDWQGFSGSSKPIVLEIKTNNKTKGASLSHTDNKATTKQKEVLLARGQKYKIKSVGAKDGQIYVRAEMK